MASAPTTSLSVAREARKFEYELIAERIKRTLDKGELIAECKMVRLPGGDSQIHAFTRAWVPLLMV